MALPAGMFMKRFGYRRDYFRVMPVCCWCVRFYSGGLFAFGISIPDRPFCDCLWALYSGNGSQPLFHDFRAGGIGGATPNLSQSFNGLGWILGPLVGGMLIFGEESDPFTLTKPHISWLARLFYW